MRLALPALLPASLAACAGLAAEELTPTTAVAEVGPGGVARVIAAGEGPVSDEALADAVRAALESSRIFDRADGGEGADWTLLVSVVAMERPELALDMTASVTMGWTLRDSAGAPVWSATIPSRFRATPEEAADVEERGAHALAGAVRAGLREGLARLAALELPPPER